MDDGRHDGRDGTPAPRCSRRGALRYLAGAAVGLAAAAAREAGAAPGPVPTPPDVRYDPAPAVLLGATVLRAVLAGGPTGDPDGAGHATLVVFPPGVGAGLVTPPGADTGTAGAGGRRCLFLGLRTERLAPVTAVVLRADGVEGDGTAALELGPTADADVLGACADEATAAAIVAAPGGFLVEVRTAPYPDGALRGRLG